MVFGRGGWGTPPGSQPYLEVLPQCLSTPPRDVLRFREAVHCLLSPRKAFWRLKKQLPRSWLKKEAKEGDVPQSKVAMGARN